MPKLTMKERKRRFEEYQRTRTPEDIRIEALKDEADKRFLDQLDPNEPCCPSKSFGKPGASQIVLASLLIRDAAEVRDARSLIRSVLLYT